MKKLYFLDEQEKNRILNLHTEATKKQYLIENKMLLLENKLWRGVNEFFEFQNFFRKKGSSIDVNGNPIFSVKTHIPQYIQTQNKVFNNAFEDTLESFKKWGNDKLDDLVYSRGESLGLKDSTSGIIFNFEDLEAKITKLPLDKKLTPDEIDDLVTALPREVSSKLGGTYPFQKTLRTKLNEWNNLIKGKTSNVKNTELIPPQGVETRWTKLGDKITDKAIWVGGTSLTLLIAYLSVMKALDLRANYSAVNSGCHELGKNIDKFCSFPEDNPKGYTQSSIDVGKREARKLETRNVGYGTYEDDIQKALSNFISPYGFCSFIKEFKNLLGKWKGSFNQLGGYAKLGISNDFINFIYWEFYAESYLASEPVSNFNVYVAQPINDFITKITSQLDGVKKVIETDKKDLIKSDNKPNTGVNLPADPCATNPDGFDCFAKKYPKFNVLCIREEIKNGLMVDLNPPQGTPPTPPQIAITDYDGVKKWYGVKDNLNFFIDNPEKDENYIKYKVGEIDISQLKRWSCNGNKIVITNPLKS